MKKTFYASLGTIAGGAMFTLATAVTGSTVLVCSAFVTKSAAAQTELIYNVWLPRRHPFFVGVVKPWKERVEAASSGRIKVRFPAKSLAPPPRQWNATIKGITDVALLGNNFERKRITLSMIGQLPFSSTTARKASTALWATHGKYFTSANQYKGIKLLGLFGITGHDLMTKDAKPITKVADLKGRKMWASAVPQMEKLGAVVLATPAPKIYELVSGGVVNGAAVIAYGYNSFRIQKFIKSFTSVPGGIGSSTFSILMNSKKFDGLSAADKQVIMKASGAQIARDAVVVDKLTDKAMKDMKAAGVNMVTASPAFMADLKRELAFMETNWLADAAKQNVDGKAALAFYRSQL